MALMRASSSATLEASRARASAVFSRLSARLRRRDAASAVGSSACTPEPRLASARVGSARAAWTKAPAPRGTRISSPWRVFSRFSSVRRERRVSMSTSPTYSRCASRAESCWRSDSPRSASSRSSCSEGPLGAWAAGRSATSLHQRELLLDGGVRDLVGLDLGRLLDPDLVAVRAVAAAQGGEDAVAGALLVGADGLHGEGGEGMAHTELAGDAEDLHRDRPAIRPG